MGVFNIYHYNGKVPPGGVNIMRGSIFGNKFRSAIYGKDKCLELYEADLINRVKTEPEFRQAVLDLNDKDLYCVCAPRRCHGHILARVSFKIAMGEL